MCLQTRCDSGVSDTVNLFFIYFLFFYSCFLFFCLFCFAEKSVYLSPVGDIPFGTYTIPISVSDSSGRRGISEISVNYCDCVTPSDCGSPRSVGSVTLGVWAILAMILGSLLLLCKYTFYLTKCKTLCLLKLDSGIFT